MFCCLLILIKIRCSWYWHKPTNQLTKRKLHRMLCPYVTWGRKSSRCREPTNALCWMASSSKSRNVLVVAEARIRRHIPSTGASSFRFHLLLADAAWERNSVQDSCRLHVLPTLKCRSRFMSQPHALAHNRVQSQVQSDVHVIGRFAGMNWWVDHRNFIIIRAMLRSQFTSVWFEILYFMPNTIRSTEYGAYWLMRDLGSRVAFWKTAACKVYLNWKTGVHDPCREKLIIVVMNMIIATSCDYYWDVIKLPTYKWRKIGTRYRWKLFDCCIFVQFAVRHLHWTDLSMRLIQQDLFQVSSGRSP